MTPHVMLDLNPDLPHSPQRTAELTATLVEIVRVLNCATAAGAAPPPGLGWPVSPEDLLDRLACLAEGTEQLYPHLADALLTHHADGAWRVAAVSGSYRDLDAELGTVAEHLRQARELAAETAVHLLKARNLLSAVRPNHPRAGAGAAAERKSA